jgi:K+-sensing histidine kinase KdpD
VIIAAAVVPLLICLLLTALRGSLANTNAALLLVLVVVGAASSGSRAAGLVAAVSSAAGFDFFLTAPYESFAIHSQDNVETAVLLVLIGVAVTEIALWGRRQQARASEQRGYLDGLLQTTVALAGTASAETVTEAVEQQLEELLDLDRAAFVHQWAAGAPELLRDGSVVHGDHPLDVDRLGLPTDTEVVLPVGTGPGAGGAFRLVAATHVARPSRQQRQVAILLADEVATALRHESSQQ